VVISEVNFKLGSEEFDLPKEYRGFIVDVALSFIDRRRQLFVYYFCDQVLSANDLLEFD